MKEGVGDAAAELLKLEELYRVGGLDDYQEQRWRELVTYIISTLEPTQFTKGKRKNIRLPTELKVNVQENRFRIECTLKNISHSGMCLHGELDRIAIDDSVEVQIAGLDESPDPIRLACRIVWKQGDSANQTAGLEILETTPLIERKRFFGNTYYPSYIEYLKNLAR